MQRVVSINLNGNAYQLEEAGYNALFAYLDARETEIKDDPERARKMADLEREVAARCLALLTPTKNVIASAEIEQITLELGLRPNPTAGAESTWTPSDATSSQSSSQSTSSQSSSQ